MAGAIKPFDTLFLADDNGVVDVGSSYSVDVRRVGVVATRRCIGCLAMGDRDVGSGPVGIRLTVRAFGLNFVVEFIFEDEIALQFA